MKKNLQSSILNFSILLIALFFPLLIKAADASLFLSPSTGTYKVGSTFTVQVKVNSGGQEINAVDGILNFDPHKLQVSSISKSGSILSLWTTNPNFSNSTGIITFGGGIPQKFNGNSGILITVNFEAKTVGVSRVDFSSGSVLAADYEGTNILTIMESGSYGIQAEIVNPIYIPPKNTPEAPIIASTTHSDPEKWYSSNDPELSWELPSDVTGVSLLLNKKVTTDPGPISDGLMGLKSFEDIEDGIWYFHIKFKNQDGWGWINHYKIQVDATPPELFEIQAKEGEETTNTQPTLIFEVIDETSGIDHYEVKIDQEASVVTEEKEYKIPPQSLGRHTVIVRALDKAGNERLGVTEINILPIEIPIITDYPQTLIPGSIISIKGTAVPEGTLKVHVQKDEREIKIGETSSNEKGNWSYTESAPLEKGVYNVWVEARDSLGGVSKPSEKVTIKVLPPVFIRIGELAIDYLTTIITLFILILVMILGILWVWRKIKERRRRLKKEITEAERALYLAFKSLKEEAERQVAKLDRKPGLSEIERTISSDLKEALKKSEKIIEKEIEDIEKELGE